MPPTDAALKQFFSATTFAVAGASSDPSKFGYKVLHWYTSHALTSIPLNPTHASITLGTGVTLATLPSPSSLPSPSTTSLSIITPAAATRRVLREARDAGVRAVWMQPGSFGEDELRFAREVWGVGCLAGGGDCVLVHGERGLELVGREREREGRL